MNVVLRAIAILIAIAGMIDPAWSIPRPVAKRLIAIRMTASPVATVEQALRASVPGWDLEYRDAAARLPCGPAERCVMIADGSTDTAIPDDLTPPPSLITVNREAGPNVSVRSVSVSRGHHSAGGVARVELSANEPGALTAGGASTTIRILDGGAVIGTATYQWGKEQATTIDVPWWAIETGARALRIEAVPADSEHTIIDNAIDIGVNVAVARSPVLVVDARPSWHSTFIRRALEQDPRFVVGYRARLAPALSAGTANGRLDAAVLDAASAVVIGGLDALTSTDVELLDHYVRVRGGALVLLPERQPGGPVSRLIPGSWREHLSATAEPVGTLRASEILRIDQAPVTATVLARSGSSLAMIAAPSGNGRIIIAGAMDAWRYRSSSFDTFWRSLIAEAAATGKGLQVAFDHAVASRGSRANFTIRDRRMAPASSSEATAIARCGTGPATAIRVWPAGPIGTFVGEAPLPDPGECTIDATVGERHAVGAIAVAESPRRGIGQTLSKLERGVTASGGVVARAGGEAALSRAITSSADTAPIVTAAHPMRSAWWMLPFAGCLSAEWWLRRRNGSA